MLRRPLRMKKPSPTRFVLATLAVALAAGACTPIVELRGNLPPPEQLAEVVVGKSSRDDVQSLLGTPSNVSPFDDDAWYYVSTVTERVSFFEPDVKERKVIAVLFDRSGTVRAIDTKGLADGHDVIPVGRETPTAGQEMTILKQLLGNMGRFSKPAQGQ
ncbi:outer membrane protein assembly factor BamE [Magnetospirillum molischianum]|uniref:Small protein A (TmRNA-binding) n=1 Tax=Magnetospirillum molischianum DSM 120 TaxID=1150626 RepID=H8FUV6_MAGML|nr:outer membrane protein assembly factor BamE [Magnetospirillum molischianum]CCG42144.1 Small protein A (TmRNA-binding) [Magnetospirillum molischianum DSM 120]